MAFQDFTRSLGQAAPSIGEGVGRYFGDKYFGKESNAGANLGRLGGSLLSSLLQGMGGQSPEDSAQQQLLGELRQRNTQPFEPIAAEARRNYQQTTLPSLNRYYADIGTPHSGEYANALSSSGADLESMLAAMSSQHGTEQQKMNDARMGSLGSYLQGQQELGQNQNQFNRNLGFRQQNLMSDYKLRQQHPYEAYGNAGKTGLGQQFETHRTAGKTGAVNPQNLALLMQYLGMSV